MVAADNVVYPGAPGYLEYVDGASYKTQMVEAKFEYDQKCEDMPSPKPQNVEFGYNFEVVWNSKAKSREGFEKNVKFHG